MLRSRLRPALLMSLLCSLAVLGGCASGPKQPVAAAPEQDNDPFEPLNRKVWDFDVTLDKYVLRPVAQGYRDYTPHITQVTVTNLLNNLKSPIILVNDLLQGNPDRFGQTLERTVLNTFLGFGGMIDLAAKHGLPFHDSDFGQTLGVWGVGTGPYLVLPLLGPSNPRDGIGYGVDSFADPFSIEMRAHGYDIANYSRWGLGVINDRSQTIEELDEVQKGSLDFYAAIRSLYQQQRAAAVATAKSDGAPPLPAAPEDQEPATPTPSKPPAAGPDKAK